MAVERPIRQTNWIKELHEERAKLYPVALKLMTEAAKFDGIAEKIICRISSVGTDPEGSIFVCTIKGRPNELVQITVAHNSGLLHTANLVPDAPITHKIISKDSPTNFQITLPTRKEPVKVVHPNCDMDVKQIGFTHWAFHVPGYIRREVCETTKRIYPNDYKDKTVDELVQETSTDLMSRHMDEIIQFARRNFPQGYALFGQYR